MNGLLRGVWYRVNSGLIKMTEALIGILNPRFWSNWLSKDSLLLNWVSGLLISNLGFLYNLSDS